MNKVQNKWLDKVPYEELKKNKAVAGYVVIDASCEKKREFAKVGFVFLVAVFLCSIGGFNLAMLGLATIALGGKMAYDAISRVFESPVVAITEQDFELYLQGRVGKEKTQAVPRKTG